MIFKILLVFFLLVAFVPPFRRFLLWLFVGRVLVSEQKRQQKAQRREGDVRVEKRPESSKGKFDGGDYVSYEEVKD